MFLICSYVKNKNGLGQRRSYYCHQKILPGICFVMSCLYKIGICSCYLEKGKIDELQNYFFLWHSRRDGYGKEAVG